MEDRSVGYAVDIVFMILGIWLLLDNKSNLRKATITPKNYERIKWGTLTVVLLLLADVIRKLIW